MSWLTKLKEQAQEHTILGLFALIGLLSLIVWRAVPSEVWDKVSELTPKRALWALLALTAIAAILEFAYIRVLRKEVTGKLKARFGVMWSKEFVPHCTACLSPLTSYGQYPTSFHLSTVWGFKCVKCDALIVMNDDEGNTLELKQAKQLLASNPGKSKPTEDKGVSEIEEKILVQMARNSKGDVTADELTFILKQHPERVTFILGQMEKNSYIYSICTMLGHNDPIKYYLSDKGRAFLINKNLI
jgi:hypothetical protein